LYISRYETKQENETSFLRWNSEKSAVIDRGIIPLSAYLAGPPVMVKLLEIKKKGIGLKEEETCTKAIRHDKLLYHG
jgi:hypothetical protein